LNASSLIAGEASLVLIACISDGQMSLVSQLAQAAHVPCELDFGAKFFLKLSRNICVDSDVSSGGSIELVAEASSAVSTEPVVLAVSCIRMPSAISRLATDDAELSRNESRGGVDSVVLGAEVD